MLKRITLTAAIAVTLAIGAAGCGDDDQPTATTITKSEFIAQGDEVLCTKTEQVATATASVDLKTASRPQLERFVFDGILPAVETARDDLAALQVPAGDEQQLDAIIAAMTDSIEATKADPAQLITGQDPFAEADHLISAYGLSGCPA